MPSSQKKLLRNSFSFNLNPKFSLLAKSKAKLGWCRKANRFWLLLNWNPLPTFFIHHSDLKGNFSEEYLQQNIQDIEFDPIEEKNHLSFLIIVNSILQRH